MPTLSQAGYIANTLDHLAVHDGIEIIVVDGGSRYGTPEIVAGRGIAMLLRGQPDRAGQMNRGAAAATGDVLSFLHADTLLLPEPLTPVRETLNDSRVVGGKLLPGI